MISLVVPVYNVAPYLEEFLESVLKQTFEDFEAVLVDDGSTDGSGDLLDDYAKKSSKLKVIHKENGGVISAWKRGIVESSGEYVSFADPDDILMPDMLSMQYKLLTENDADIVISGINRLEDGKLEASPADQWSLKEGLYEGESLENLKKNLFGSKINPQTVFFFWKPNKFFKRKTLLANLDYSVEGLSFGDDVCISASAIYDSKKLYYSHTPLYIYRIRGNSLSTVTFNSKQLDDADLLIHSVRRLISDKGYMNDFVYYNDPSYHILRLMRKITDLAVDKNTKKELLENFKNHPFIADYDLKKAKKFISFKRYLAIWLLKHSMYSLLLKIL